MAIPQSVWPPADAAFWPLRCLITGAGGSIGCHVLRHITKETNWEVVCVDSFRHRGLTDRIYRVLRNHPETHHRVTVITHDLQAPISEMVSRKIGRVDFVINLAAISDVDISIADPTTVIIANNTVAANVLEWARQTQHYSLKAFLHVSTDEVYGPVDGTNVHKEWSPIVPSNPYSASKAGQEATAICYWRTYGIPLILVNIMNNFGEMQSPAKFPAMCQRMIRAGETVKIHEFGKGIYGSRFYIHSRNAADGMLYLLQRHNPARHQPGCVDRPSRFNIVGDQRVDNLKLAQLIAKFIGKPLKWEPMDAATSRPGHDLHYGLDGSKLAEFGWKAPYPFEYSLEQTVKWYERNPEWLSLR